MNMPMNSSPPVEDLPEADASRPMRVGLLVLALGLGGFLVWAAYAPLDEGVPTSASVVVDTKRKPVQHLTGGILSEVLVREGQKVKAGEVVARLNASTSRANYESVRQHYMGLSAMESRIMAEQQGAQKCWVRRIPWCNSRWTPSASCSSHGGAPCRPSWRGSAQASPDRRPWLQATKGSSIAANDNSRCCAKS
jgi:hypothetical protein